MDTFEGWAADPTGQHDARYFMEGRPTPLVRDGTVESFDVLPEPPGALPSPPGEGPPGVTSAAASTAGATPSPGAPPPYSPLPSASSYWGPRGEPRGAPASPGRPVPAAPGSPFAVTGTAGAGLPGSFTAAPAPPPRHRVRRVVTTASALVVAALVASLVLVFTGGKSAEATVIDSVSSTMADRTAHVTVDLSGSAGSEQVTGSGTGAVDFSRNALQLTMNASAAGTQVQLQFVYLAGVVYESVPGIDQILPGKSWVSLDLSSLQKLSGDDPGAMGTGDNPAAMLRMLAQHGNTVEPLGPSTVDGVAVDGYSVVLNAGAIKADLADADLPSWMRSIVDHVHFQSMSNKVYIDDAGLLRRYTMTISEGVGALGASTVRESLDFSDYGAPVSVTAPLPGQVADFQQLLQAAAAAPGADQAS